MSAITTMTDLMQELERVRDLLRQLEQELFNEKSLHVATQACLTAQTESVLNCANKVAVLRSQLAASQARSERLTLALQYLSDLGGGNSEGNYYAKASLAREVSVLLTPTDRPPV